MSQGGVGIGVGWRGAWKRVRWTLGHAAKGILRTRPLGDRGRRYLAGRMWARKPSAMLDSYLVSGYQNPRINIQSILIRHFLIRRLFADEFTELMEAEIRLAVELNEVLRVRAAELGVPMGAFINPLKYARVKLVDHAIAGRDKEFVDRWTGVLAEREAEPLSVLEFACGSANDYRAFVEYGLARFLDYRGVDLTAKNVANARRRFPTVRFDVGNVVSLPDPDGAVDCVIASDLFEHLAIEDMERALAEAGRLARRAVILSFFNLADIPDHSVRPKASYFVNRLSKPRVEAQLRRRFPSITATPIAPWLADEYDYPHSYNSNAWTIVAERPPG